MPEGREDVIAAGALIWSRIVTRVLARAEAAGHSISEIITSEHDILDGIAMAMVDQACARAASRRLVASRPRGPMAEATD